MLTATPRVTRWYKFSLRTHRAVVLMSSLCGYLLANRAGYLFTRLATPWASTIDPAWEIPRNVTLVLFWLTIQAAVFIYTAYLVSECLWMRASRSLIAIIIQNNDGHNIPGLVPYTGPAASVAIDVGISMLFCRIVALLSHWSWLYKLTDGILIVGSVTTVTIVLTELAAIVVAKINTTK